MEGQVIQDILFTPQENRITYAQGLWDMAQLLFILGTCGVAVWVVLRLARNAVRAVRSRIHGGHSPAPAMVPPQARELRKSRP